MTTYAEIHAEQRRRDAIAVERLGRGAKVIHRDSRFPAEERWLVHSGRMAYWATGSTMEEAFEKALNQHKRRWQSEAPHA